MNSPLIDNAFDPNGQLSPEEDLRTSDAPVMAQTAFERWVLVDGKRASVIAGSRVVSYHELNRQAEGIAHALVEAGVCPGHFVGICLPRSVAQIAAVLGVLKAGAACLPIDATDTAKHIQLVCRDALTSFILTSATASHMLAAVSGRKMLADVLVHGPTGGGTSSCPAQEDAPAYLMYTPSPNGLPKGVVMPHRALVNLLRWHERALPRPARTLQLAPLSSDLAFQEIFSTLSAGGTLVLMDEAQRRDPKGVWNLIKAKQVERLFVPAAGLLQLAAVVDGPCRLREVITFGEQLRITPQIRRMFVLLAPCTLRNQYGPSETNAVTDYEMGGSPVDWPALPPAGKPIDRTYVTLEPIPGGRPDQGQILIAGRSLCDGYLYRPDLNAEKFVVLEDGRRYFRTGDLGGFVEDGNLQVLGRMAAK
ncbi:MAG: AMP-binding protein [Verrucomicrobia bacterium]|nr:AMP-binding protein [Verrucomicrobiota bacterium]